MSNLVKRLRAADSVLVVVDIQDKLLAKIPTAKELVANAGFMIDVASLLDVPVRATEQYPKGLGSTTGEILRRLTEPVPAKTAFSCCETSPFLDELTMLRRPNIVLVGMESHVCVQQTAFDLLEAGLHVFLPLDAIASRNELDHSTAIRRMERAGVILTTVESIAFEWIGDAAHSQFKAISKLVIARSS